MNSSQPTPGWYPVAQAEQQYWDGTAWTEQTRPTPAEQITLPSAIVDDPLRLARRIAVAGWVLMAVAVLLALVTATPQVLALAALLAVPLGSIGVLLAILAMFRGAGSNAIVTFVLCAALAGAPFVALAVFAMTSM